MQSNVSNKATNLYTDSNYQLYSVVYLSVLGPLLPVRNRMMIELTGSYQLQLYTTK